MVCRRRYDGLTRRAEVQLAERNKSRRIRAGIFTRRAKKQTQERCCILILALDMVQQYKFELPVNQHWIAGTNSSRTEPATDDRATTTEKLPISIPRFGPGVAS